MVSRSFATGITPILFSWIFFSFSKNYSLLSNQKLVCQKASYGNRIRAKYTAKWGVQIAEMIFQTRSNSLIV
ncbi:MAG: DUF6783 domain-containing protein [Blautia sp.]